MSKLLTIKQLSEKINVPTSTLYLWVEKGRIPVVRLPNGIRFEESDIERWIKTLMIKEKPLGTV